MSKKRVVITGLGVVSPIGIGKDAFWGNLKAGKSGIKPITLFDTKDVKVKLAGEVTDFEPKEILGKKGLVDFDRTTKLLLSAGKFALDDTSFEINEENTYSTGISVGSTFGNLQSMSDFDRESLVDGPHLVNPSKFPNTVMNAPAGRLAIRFGIKGHNCTTSTGMTASLDSLDYAINSINFNRIDRALVGGVKELAVQVFLGFYNLGYMSGTNNSHGPLSCPFDKRRDGVLFSEGASVFMVESLDSAERRNAKIYAEVLSVSSNFDPFRFYKYNPKGLGMVNAMNSALKEADINAENIDCIFANANSTKDADLTETNAIKEVFKDYSKSVSITSVKSMIGESLSASGAMSVAAALGSMEEGFVPPTINYEQKDEQCDLDYTVNKSAEKKINIAMINSFSPNGSNTVAILGKYKN
ncbi:beta-ketoacyl-[acyl-carrier-protein] synthase family protein [Elusimicrobiota bacterium]